METKSELEFKGRDHKRKCFQLICKKDSLNKEEKDLLFGYFKISFAKNIKLLKKELCLELWLKLLDECPNIYYSKKLWPVFLDYFNLDTSKYDIDKMSWVEFLSDPNLNNIRPLYFMIHYPKAARDIFCINNCLCRNATVCYNLEKNSFYFASGIYPASGKFELPKNVGLSPKYNSFTLFSWEYHKGHFDKRWRKIFMEILFHPKFIDQFDKFDNFCKYFTD